MEVYKEFRKDVLSCAFIFTLMLTVRWFFRVGADATDPPDGRSGMSLRIDHGTGLHYLESSGGHLIPRLGRDGQQIGQSNEKD